MFINAIHSRQCMDCTVKRVKSQDDCAILMYLINGPLEFDIQASMICARFNCHLIHPTGQQTDVKGKDLDVISNIPIATVVTHIPWDPMGIIMPSGATCSIHQPDWFIKCVQSHNVHSTNLHCHIYETDRILLAMHGDMEQLFME